MPPQPERVPLRSIFRVFFMIGASSFGGGLIAWVHRETCVKRRWLTNEQFLPGMALAQVLPGANVTNLAVYVGQKLRGPPGAAIAVISVLTGPFFLCIALSVVYANAVRIPGFHAAMDGIAAGAIGMIIRLGFMGGACCKRLVPGMIALAIFIMVGILRWPMVPVIGVLAPLSIALAWPRGGMSEGGADA